MLSLSRAIVYKGSSLDWEKGRMDWQESWNIGVQRKRWINLRVIIHTQKGEWQG